jgi:hypothetical protein
MTLQKVWTSYIVRDHFDQHLSPPRVICSSQSCHKFLYYIIDLSHRTICKQRLKCTKMEILVVDYCRRLLMNMTYRHKRDNCSKETRDIIENILNPETSDYDLSEVSGEKSLGKSKETVFIENGANVLVSDMDRENNHLEEMGSYQPCQEVDFEAIEVKDCFEKKKKRRNYIEFKADYVKIK